MMRNSNSKKEIRHEKILLLLKNNDVINIRYFRDQLGCSESTIRNDLAYLEKEKLLRRVFGGAIKADSTPYDLIDIEDRETIFLEEKLSIAYYVADKILKPNHTIILDAGTTTTQIAKIILERNLFLTVLTASLEIGHILSKAKNVTLFLFGGFYYSDRGFFYDTHIDQFIESIRADIYFMSVNGISAEAKFTITGQDETKIKNMFMGIASKSIVVADHSKLNRNAMKIVADSDNVDLLITDKKAKPIYIQKLKEIGLNIELAD